MILNCTQLPLPLVEINEKEKFEILEILNSKINQWRKYKLQYLMHWLGYEGTNEKLSWILADEVHTSKAISDFHFLYLDKPGSSSSL